MPLTQKQLDTTEFVLVFINEIGRRPTNKEIADHFGLKSPGSVSDRLAAFKKNVGICPYCQRAYEETN